MSAKIIERYSICAAHYYGIFSVAQVVLSPAPISNTQEEGYFVRYNLTVSDMWQGQEVWGVGRGYRGAEGIDKGLEGNLYPLSQM